MSISGGEFNLLYPNIQLYKLTNEDENHNNFQFTDGFNIDYIPFDPTGSCHSGGLYFTEYDKIGMWIYYNKQKMKYIRKVEIINDSKVYVEDNKFKADKFILRERILLEDFEGWNDKTFCKIAVQQNGLALEYVINQTEKICKLAVQKNGLALQYVIVQTKEICNFAIQQNAFALKYVIFQNNELCKLAVKQNGLSLYYVETQTKELCKLAVQQNPNALKYVKNQTKDICKLAIQKDSSVIRYVKKRKVEICKLTMQQNDFVLKYISDLSLVRLLFYLLKN